MNPPSSPKASTLLLGMGLLRDIGRLQTIATVMIRFGFVDVVQRLGLAQALASAGKVLRWESTEQAARLPEPDQGEQQRRQRGNGGQGRGNSPDGA